MSEKVVLRFEQFDEVDDNTVTYQGPIALYKTVSTFAELENIPGESGFPMPELNQDNEFDQSALPNTVVYVKNVTNFQDSKRYRGAYFRYDYINGSWLEIMLGTHSHENKDIIDKISSGNIGTWLDVTNHYSTLYGTSGLILPAVSTEGDYFLLVGALPEDTRSLYEVQKISEVPTIYDWVEVEKNTNTLFLDTEEVLLYRAAREIENNLPVMYWSSLAVTDGTVMPINPEVKDVFFKTDTEELFIFSGAKAGDRKMLILEVTDPDNSDLTYSYDVAWSELPDGVPVVPDGAEELYLGLDSAKQPVWKNTILPAQVFQVKRITIIPSGDDPGLDEEPAGNIIHVADVSYNSELDEVLVMDGNFFLHNRDISYDPVLRTMTISANEDADGSTDSDYFDSGSVVTVIIIRNGASAVLDQLASDYITKADAINLLSGGSINLNQYATKGELQEYLLRGHYHSGYSRDGHNHDDRYANYRHSHGEYVTRRKVLELIEETVAMNPGVLNILQDFSDYLDSGSNDLETILTNMASQADIDNLQSQIDAINTNYYNITQLDAYLDERRFRTDQIDTEYTDEFSQTKDLTQVLQEIKDSIESELHVIDSSNLFLDEDIVVQLGDDNIGEYDSGETVAQGTTLQTILTNMLRKRISPDIIAPQLVITGEIDEFPEIGSNINIFIQPEYQLNDGGSLLSYSLVVSDGLTTSTLVASSTADTYDDTIQILDQPFTLTASAAYADGPMQYDTLGDEAGRISSNIINQVIATITPVRAVFYGGLTTAQTSFSSDDIRSLNKITQESYVDIEIEAMIPVGTRTIVFALPFSIGELDEITYREQSQSDVLPDFSSTSVTVEGANDTSGVVYRVYYFKLPFPSTTRMNLKFIK